MTVSSNLQISKVNTIPINPFHWITTWQLCLCSHPWFAMIHKGFMGLGLKGTKEKKHQEKCCPFPPVIMTKFTSKNSLFTIYFSKFTFGNSFWILKITFQNSILKFTFYNLLFEIHIMRFTFQNSLFDLHLSKFTVQIHFLKFTFQNSFTETHYLLTKLKKVNALLATIGLPKKPT